MLDFYRVFVLVTLQKGNWYLWDFQHVFVRTFQTFNIYFTCGTPPNKRFASFSPLRLCHRHSPTGPSSKRLYVSLLIHFKFNAYSYMFTPNSVPELDTWTPSSRAEYEKTLEGVLAHAPANALLPWQIRICTQATFFHPVGQFHNFATIRASRLVHGWSGVNLPGEWIGWVDACWEMHPVAEFVQSIWSDKFPFRFCPGNIASWTRPPDLLLEFAKETPSM